jgi:hypothetical protein
VYGIPDDEALPGGDAELQPKKRGFIRGIVFFFSPGAPDQNKENFEKNLNNVSPASFGRRNPFQILVVVSTSCFKELAKGEVVRSGA